MSRVHVQARGGHVHAAWETQPIVGGARRALRLSALLPIVAFVVGLLIGLMF